MNEQQFKKLFKAAESIKSDLYRTGYRKGLRQVYFKDSHLPSDVHAAFMMMSGEFGEGYRAGYAI